MGLPLSVLHHGRLLSALVSSMARRLLATTSRIRNEEKKETKKIARGIFRSLAPLLGTAGSLSDCGIKPTIAELNFSRRYFLAPLFRLHSHASGPTNSWRLLLESAIFCAPLLVVLGACPLSRRISQSCFFCQFLPLRWICVCVCSLMAFLCCVF